MLTVKEVAKLLKIHPMTVYRLIKSGQLKVIHIGRTIRIEETVLKDFIRSKQS